MKQPSPVVLRRLSQRTAAVGAGMVLGVVLGLALFHAIAWVFGLHPPQRFLEPCTVDGQPGLRARGVLASHYATVVQPFTLAPGTNELRIAAFGGSTTAGLPYKRHTIWSWMALEIESSIRDRKITVLNFGVPGACIQDILALEREIPERTFDLAILYTGNNQFLPPHYAQSIERWKKKPIARLVEDFAELDAVAWLRGRIGPSPVGTPRPTYGREEPGDPQAEIRHAPVAYELREYVQEQASRDLVKLLSRLRARGVPVLLIVPATDGKRITPCRSAFREETPHANRRRVLDLLYKVELLRASGNITEALAELEAALALAPEFAYVHALRALLLFKQGRAAEAREEWKESEENDVQPYYATDVMRECLRRAAATLGVPSLDAHAILNDPTLGHGIESLLVDWCHPSLLGQRVVARAVVRELAEQRWIPGLDRWDSSWEVPAHALAEADGDVDAQKRFAMVFAAEMELLTILQGPAADHSLEAIGNRYREVLELYPAEARAQLGLSIAEGLLGKIESARALWRQCHDVGAGVEELSKELCFLFPRVRELRDILTATSNRVDSR